LISSRDDKATCRVSNIAGDSLTWLTGVPLNISCNNVVASLTETSLETSSCAKEITAAFKASDTAKFDAACAIPDDAATTKSFTCEYTNTSTQAAGKYDLQSITDAGDSSTTPATPGKTFDLNGKTASLTIAETVELGDQTTSQEVDPADTENNSFKIVFKTEPTAVPQIFANSTVTTPLATCTIDTTDKKTVVCKPTAAEMPKGEYQIHYLKGCTKTDTGVKVDVAGSSLLTLSKVAVVILALLF
jgi:hypothetical protein